MIARIWHGWTTPEDSDAYERLLLDEVFPWIEGRQIRGYRGVQLLRREEGDEVEFVTIMWFDSLDDAREFAGPGFPAAVVPSAAQALLARFDSVSAHYNVIKDM